MGTSIDSLKVKQILGHDNIGKTFDQKEIQQKISLLKSPEPTNRNGNSPRQKLQSMDWYNNPQEVEINYTVEASNPNNLLFKSPRTIMVNEFEKEEINKLRNKQKFMSQSLIFRKPLELRGVGSPVSPKEDLA